MHISLCTRLLCVHMSERQQNYETCPESPDPFRPSACIRDSAPHLLMRLALYERSAAAASSCIAKTAWCSGVHP